MGITLSNTDETIDRKFSRKSLALLITVDDLYNVVDLFIGHSLVYGRLITVSANAQ